MRTPVILAMLVLSNASLASFELMLVADAGGRDIDRYDPVTGTYLGSFGAGFLSIPTDVDVDSASGLAYVCDNGSTSIKVFNYNTGEFVRSWSTGNPNYFVTRLSSGNIVVSNYGWANSRQFSPTGTLIRTQNTSTAYVEGHAQASDGNIWWIDHSGKRLMRGAETNLNPVFMYGHYNPNGQEFLSASGNELASIDYWSGTGIQMTRFTLTSGLVTGENYLYVGATPSEYNGGTSFGHGGVIYGAVTTTSASRYATWVRGDNFVTMRPLSQTQYAQGMTTVIAPEPGALFAMGWATVALIRRRRKVA